MTVLGQAKPNAILVVTADDALADALSRTLATAHYEVLERASTGTRALEILARQRAALVLVDAVLAGENDAFALATHARHRFRVPVLYIVGAIDDAELTRLRVTRPSGYIGKPPDERELRSAIEIALHKRSIVEAASGGTDENLATEAAELAREARRSKDQRLAQAERLASLAKVAGMMAHEVNNPLTYVVANLGFAVETFDDLRTAFARIAATDPKIAPDVDRALGVLREVSEALDEAQKGAGRVRRVMQDLARFVRADDPRTSLIDLPDVLDEAIAMAAVSTKTNVTTERTYRTTPFVEGNISQLVQLFTNILVNATEATKNREDAHVRVTTSTDEGGRACVEIADNGIGITGDVIARVFEPFFSTRESTSSMGLGLTVSREIATRLGGEITAKNATPGAVLSVALPPAARADARMPRPKTEVAPRPRGRVLVVDDEAAIAKLVERILRASYDVVVENDARVALGRIASGERFDVIFCDLMMPHLTGMDLYATLVASNQEVAKRFVFMTGGAFSERSREFLDKVEIVSIAKPFSAETLRTLARDFTR